MPQAPVNRRDLAKAFSTRLRSARVARRLSQTELGRLTGVGQPAIAHLERGTSLPGVHRLVNPAQALDVSTDFLVGLDDDPTRREGMTLDDFSRAFAIIHPDDRQLVLQLIDRFTSRGTA